MMSEECPNCRQLTNSSFSRLVKDSCGHTKCRMCLLYEEHGCKACNDEHTIQNLNTFGCIPSISQTQDNIYVTTQNSTVTEEKILPLELVIHKDVRSKDLEFNSIGNIQDEEFNVREIMTIDNERTDICRPAADDTGNNIAANTLYIPKMEPCDVVSNICAQLTEPNNITLTSEVTCTTTTTTTATAVVPINSETRAEKPKEEKLVTNKQLKHPDRSHISVIPGDPEKYKCNVCNKIFRNKKGKCYHDACVTGVKPYKCNICDRSFVKRSHFEYHERVHSGYKPYKCNLCDKAFPQQNKLNRHMYSHSKEKQFVCSKCDKRYSKRDDLRNHLPVHNDTKPHTCKICKKSYHILAALTRHMRTHNNERPHVCDQCNKSFKDSSLLARHKRTHGKERPFSCVHCNRVFLSKSELMRHMTVHSDEKPFSCEYCQTVFRRKDNLNRHIRHHHSEDSNYESNKTQTVVPEANKKITKKPPVNSQRQKQKPKRSTKNVLNLLPKSPAKVTAVSVNSHEQINSRLDSMGNITPVIRNTSELSNAVPVINGPISVQKPNNKTDTRKKTFTYTEPIPLAEAVVINRRIEEKLYPQNNYFFRNCSTHIDKLHNTSVTQSIRTNFSVRNSPSIKSISFENSSSDLTTPRSTSIPQNVKSTVQEMQKNDVNNKRQACVKTTTACEKSSEFNPSNKSSMNESIVNVTETVFDSHVNSMEINLFGSLIREEKTNCVSTIKKHTLHQSELSNLEESNTVNSNTVTITKSSLPKYNETVKEKNQSNMHWRRRAAEIFKECGQ